MYKDTQTQTPTPGDTYPDWICTESPKTIRFVFNMSPVYIIITIV